MRLEILRQMTDEELEYMSAYLHTYKDYVWEISPSYDVEEEYMQATNDLDNVKQVQEERKGVNNEISKN